jgi:hypothetical protein
VASIEANLKDYDSKGPYFINVFIVYKPKAKKVRPVNTNDKTNKTLKKDKINMWSLRKETLNNFRLGNIRTICCQGSIVF